VPIFVLKSNLVWSLLPAGRRRNPCAAGYRGTTALPTLPRLLHPVTWGGALLAVAAAAHPAAALTIDPSFTSSITGATNAAQVEGAINAAIGTIDSLYSNSGSVAIVFTQAPGGFIGESETADVTESYATYTSLLTATSAQEPTNTALSTAIANLAPGNMPGAGGSVFETTADAQIALGQTQVTGCFNSGGAFVSSCGQAFDGVVTLSTSQPLNFGTKAVAGQFSAINAMEHEINEMLGGGGQGSVLNEVADCENNPSATTSPSLADCSANDNFVNDRGVLDLYRFSATGVPSFTTNPDATSFFSVNGGVTDIVGFNQDSSGDFGDFVTNDNVQSAFTSPGGFAPLNQSSPEFAMLESLGFDGIVPEPASMAVFATGLLGLRVVRRRVRKVQ
jgi:hypothetical protein